MASSAAAIPSGKPTARARQRAARKRRALLHQRHREARERTELGADHHRPDDQDRLVLEDARRGDQAGQDHEGEEGPAELGVLVGARLDLLPHHRVGGQRRARASRRGRAPSESWVSMKSSVIEPVSGMSSSAGRGSPRWRPRARRRPGSRRPRASRPRPGGGHVEDRALGAQQVEASWRCPAGRRSAGGSRRGRLPGRARAPPGRRPGSASCPSSARSMKTCRSSPSARRTPSRSTSMWVVMPVVPSRLTEARSSTSSSKLGGAQVADADLGHHHVRARFHHPRVPSGHLAPELRHQHVEPGHVMRVEDHVLRVALRVPHAQAVGEAAGHRSSVPPGRDFPLRPGCSAG